VTVKAWLDGHQFDLEDLVYLLPTGDVRVIKEGDRYYLSAPELDNPPQGKQFYEVAPDALNRVNAIGRLNRPEFQPVKLAMQFETDHGHHHHVVVKGAAISRSKAYGVLVSANGQVQIPPPPGPDQVRVAHTHPDGAQALEILGTSSALGWVELYRPHAQSFKIRNMHGTINHDLGSGTGVCAGTTLVGPFSATPFLNRVSQVRILPGHAEHPRQTPE